MPVNIINITGKKVINYATLKLKKNVTISNNEFLIIFVKSIKLLVMKGIEKQMFY